MAKKPNRPALSVAGNSSATVEVVDEVPPVVESPVVAASQPEDLPVASASPETPNATTQVESNGVLSEVAAPLVETFQAAPKEPAFRVTAVEPTGFWRIGRHFSKTPVVIKASELTDAQKARLLSELPTSLKVEVIEV